MKVVIFAGGIGSRITEESHLKPKPMIEIGGKPILWHILKSYSMYGYTDFIICLGYKGHLIKEYFVNYFRDNSDLSVDVKNNKITIHPSNLEPFKVTLVDTGLETKTAGRLARIEKYIGKEDFMLTYGDGLSDIDFKELVKFHKSHGKIATVTAYQPKGKFGGMILSANNKVERFQEKPKGDGKWINAGFFVLSPKVFKYLDKNSDHIMWEESPMEKLTSAGQLVAYKHTGFWKCMDAMRDKIELETMWKSNKAKWKKW